MDVAVGVAHQQVVLLLVGVGARGRRTFDIGDRFLCLVYFNLLPVDGGWLARRPAVLFVDRHYQVHSSSHAAHERDIGQEVMEMNVSDRGAYEYL